MRGINQQRDQADHSEIGGRGANSDEHSRCKGPQRRDDYGCSIVASRECSKKNSQRAQHAGREHALGALGVGITPVGIGNVECAAGHYHAAARHVQGEPSGQGQDQADGVTQGQVGGQL